MLTTSHFTAGGYCYYENKSGHSAMTTETILPPNITNAPQAGQEAPGSIFIQPPGTVQYISFEGYQLGNPGNPVQQQGNPSQQQRNPLEKLLKVETKTLGAIQIMIGLMHIGLGCIAISILMSGFHYIPFGATSGYPFWGGLFFISSGSLAVSSEKYLNGSLVRCSVGMNIMSAVIALTGIMLYIAELVVTTTYSYYYNPYDSHPSYYYYYFSRAGPVTVEVLFLLFSLLEFCINVSTAHFGCQAACSTSEPVTVLVPYAANFPRVAPSESNPMPPNYHDIAHPPKIETQ
nr:membrane-spanning 4-domains subfamily A member 8-like [Anolis sagrei ordinatus]